MTVRQVTSDLRQSLAHRESGEHRVWPVPREPEAHRESSVPRVLSEPRELRPSRASAADTVDVKFVLMDENEGRTEKTIALPHADLVRVSGELGRPLDDPWCARIAALHLLHLIQTGEDMEKDLVTILPADLKRHASEIARMEQAEVGAR